MEAAGILWTASTFGVPLLCVKAITDIVGSATGGDDFKLNFDRAIASLLLAVPAVLEVALRLLPSSS
jgi:nucleoside phosphorylase